MTPHPDTKSGNWDGKDTHTEKTGDLEVKRKWEVSQEKIYPENEQMAHN